MTDMRQVHEYLRMLPTDREREAYIRGIVAEREAERAKRQAAAMARGKR